MDEVLNFTEENEGFKSKPYCCPIRKWVFGYGYNAGAGGITAY